MHRLPSLLFAPLLVAAGEAPAAPAAASTADVAIKVASKLLPGSPAAELRQQALPAWDRPAGEGFTICGRQVAVRVDAKGRLEVDPDGKGFKVVPRSGMVQVKVEREVDGKAKSTVLPLRFTRADDGTWLWRNAGAVGLVIAGEELLAVDLDGDGAFNGAGTDGLIWNGQVYAFPQPGPDERWCTAKHDLTGFRMGPWGESPEVRGRPIATTVPAALGVLQGVNEERVKIGLTPRPENAQLSADLQKHCHYMVGTGKLAHPEDAGTPGYTAEGHAAGMRSILSQGTPADRVAAGMVATLYHRHDVVRPWTAGFGVGYEGRFGGIDGRTDLASPKAEGWPILCPVPEQRNVPARFQSESPDPIAGDKDAGFPVTAYFQGGSLKLVEGTLAPLGKDGKPGPALDCYRFDDSQGGDPTFNRFQHVVCLIAKDPLAMATVYQVRLRIEVDGAARTLAWNFQTEGAGKK